MLSEKLIEFSGDDFVEKFLRLFRCCAGSGCQCASKCHKKETCFRDYALLPVRLPGARGYVGGEFFMGLKDLKAKCKGKWTFNTVVRDYDSVRNNSGSAIGNECSRGKYWSWCGR
jgi:hypothetical protein